MLDVIGAGFGRTGTASLKAALDHLGFGPCYHMFEILAQPERMTDWSRALDGDLVNWGEVFRGYRSTVDWPGTAFWRELSETSPDAKVILTVRDSQRWYDSTYNTIYQLAKAGQDPASDSPGDQLLPTIDRMIWQGTFGGRFEERDHAIEVFEQHNAEVQRAVASNRLLVYEVGQGWEPLCAFLGVDVPDEHFPHVNDTASLPRIVDEVRREGRVRSPITPRN